MFKNFCPMLSSSVPFWLVKPAWDAGKGQLSPGVRHPDSTHSLMAHARAHWIFCGATRKNGEPCRAPVKPGERCRYHSGPNKIVARRRAAARLKTAHSVEYTERRAARALHEKHWKAGNHWFGAPLIELPEDLIVHLETITGLSVGHIAPSILNWAGWQWQQLVRERRATRLSGGQVGIEAAIELFSRELPRRIAEAGPRPVQPDLPERPVWMDWVETPP